MPNNAKWVEKPDAASLTKVLKLDVHNIITFQIWNFKYLHACSLHILNLNDNISLLYYNTRFYQDTTSNVFTSEAVAQNFVWNLHVHTFTVYLVITVVFWVVIPA
jgi:hypothetical protein